MSSPQYVDVPTEQAYETPVSNSPLLPLLLLSLATQSHTPRAKTCLKDEYDFIVVGGGTAGSVVASRLSEDENSAVLLLEAGHMPPLLTEVPGFTSYFEGSDIDWNFKTVPQKRSAYGKKDRKIAYAMFKVLGGSSTQNIMMAVRGNHKHYDDWAAQGAKGWSYKKVLPYFKKLEDFKVAKYLNRYHGTNGSMTMAQPDYNPELRMAMTAAVSSLGSKPIDSNAKRQTGFYDLYATMRGGQRCSVVKGYLVPAENRTNLDIFINAQVTKVLIENNQATGVEFYYGGQFQTIKARKEVIVSAGTVNTPKLLMLSGVGPAAQLTKLKIPVVADLPVGENFQDHPTAIYYFTIKTPSDPFPEKLKNPAFIQEYISKRSGPLASTQGVHYDVFARGLTVNSTIDFPNVFFNIGEYPCEFSEGNFKSEVYKQFIEPYKDDNVCACYVHTPQPESRGTVTINSSNPFDPPLIDPNYLADPSDLDPLVVGMEFCQKILQTPSFKAINAKPFETKVPSCEKYSTMEDEYLKCYARTLLANGHHGAGTCKMGAPDDPTTVVDPQLRVKNVKGLRVVDASVMPILPSGTYIPTMMIAEKASDMIKKKYSPKKRKTG